MMAPSAPSICCVEPVSRPDTVIRVCPEYQPGYFGVFMRDADGNKAEAVLHTF